MNFLSSELFSLGVWSQQPIVNTDIIAYIFANDKDFPFCLGYFSLSVTEDHNQGSLYKKALTVRNYSSRRLESMTNIRGSREMAGRLGLEQ